MTAASESETARDQWIKVVLFVLLILDPTGSRLGWAGSAILGAYLLGIAAWLLFNRRRHGRWISWGGRELSGLDLLFITLIIATFAGIAIVRPLGIFSLRFSIVTAIWVIGLCLAYEWLRRRRVQNTTLQNKR
jgi:hypothetical protein